ncbi:MAG: SPOR domain-containing protein [Magnetococcales bacterium]|nr:SPOR domain-containing protein [Magnetococcales bacterium]
MTTPRYPTSAKYRRHRSKSPYLAPAIIGVLFGCGVYLLVQFFTSDNVAVGKNADSAKSAKVEIPEDVMPISEDDISDDQMVSVNIPIDFQPRRVQKKEIKKQKFKPSSKHQDIVEQIIMESSPEIVEVKPPPPAKPVKEPVPEPDQFVEKAMPSDLRPKPRDPDVEITFYREFSKRKVVVPKEELIPETIDVSGLIEVSKINKPRPKPLVNKVGLLGVYQVQLVIFSDLERANAVVKALRRKRAPAYLVKVKGDKDYFYRVRLGPFSSQVEAKWAMDRWKIKGSSPLILRQRP